VCAGVKAEDNLTCLPQADTTLQS